MSLNAWGWDAGWREALSILDGTGLRPGRVTIQERTLWTVQTEEGPREARVRPTLHQTVKAVEGLTQAFAELQELAAKCRFRDCTHATEPGCAVLEAVGDGRLDPERLESYRKLEAEAAYVRRKTDPRARAQAVSEFKSIMKTLRHHPKYRTGE